jgi:hypothetical protein
MALGVACSARVLARSAARTATDDDRREQCRRKEIAEGAFPDHRAHRRPKSNLRAPSFRADPRASRPATCASHDRDVGSGGLEGERRSPSCARMHGADGTGTLGALRKPDATNVAADHGPLVARRLFIRVDDGQHVRRQRGRRERRCSRRRCSCRRRRPRRRRSGSVSRQCKLGPLPPRRPGMRVRLHRLHLPERLLVLLGPGLRRGLRWARRPAARRGRGLRRVLRSQLRRNLLLRVRRRRRRNRFRDL